MLDALPDRAVDLIRELGRVLFAEPAALANRFELDKVEKAREGVAIDELAVEADDDVALLVGNFVGLAHDSSGLR